MADASERVDRAVATVREFLGGPFPEGNGWTFEFGEHLESNWGAVYGGAIAASVLAVARCAAPDRSPRSLHLQLVRSVPSGPATASATLRHAGRTITTVEVNLHDARDKVAVIALVTMVNPEAVAAQHHHTSVEPFRTRMVPVGPGAIRAPIQDALDMRVFQDGVQVHRVVENRAPSIDGNPIPAMEISVPWEERDATGPEAACLAADAIVAAPIVDSDLPATSLGPNPDLSLRFTTAAAASTVAVAGTLLSVHDGTTMVGVEVQSGGQLLAHGLATSLLLDPERTSAPERGASDATPIHPGRS